VTYLRTGWLYILSTPSLGITKLNPNADPRTVDWAFNSLSRDHQAWKPLEDFMMEFFGKFFQLPLSGSLTARVFGTFPASAPAFQLPLSGSPIRNTFLGK
jgi:hypothetical protein